VQATALLIVQACHGLGHRRWKIIPFERTSSHSRNAAQRRAPWYWNRSKQNQYHAKIVVASESLLFVLFRSWARIFSLLQLSRQFWRFPWIVIELFRNEGCSRAEIVSIPESIADISLPDWVRQELVEVDGRC
jgi:hypothetical protein